MAPKKIFESCFARSVNAMQCEIRIVEDEAIFLDQLEQSNIFKQSNKLLLRQIKLNNKILGKSKISEAMYSRYRAALMDIYNSAPAFTPQKNKVIENDSPYVLFVVRGGGDYQ